MRSKWIWWIFGVYVLLWTTALLLPGKATHGPVNLTPDLREIVAKTLHVCAYAIMAGLTARLPIPARYRCVLMFLLMVHGTLTELLQLYVDGRKGDLRDVGFDHLGVFIGSVISWRWWTRES